MTVEEDAARASIKQTLEEKYNLELYKKYVEFSILGLDPNSSPLAISELAKLQSAHQRMMARLSRPLATNPLDIPKQKETK